MTRLLLVLAAVLGGVATAPVPAAAQEAPRGLTAEDVEAERRLRQEGHAVVDVSAIWPTLAIEVCWEPPSGGFEAEKELVRRGVRRQIEAHSGYRFSGFGDCDADPRPRIRISVEDATPRSEVGFQGATAAFGRPRPTRMWLNLTYANWSSDYCATEANRARCVEFNAVHEFLHALGVLHEQLHHDVPREDPACFARFRDHNRFDVHGAQPVALTRYSPTSAMNYCWQRHYADGVSLSEEDRRSLARMTELSRDRMAGRRP